MKNIELYRAIETLVDAKQQQYTPNKPSFAQQYCRKQIQRKKLVPTNPKSKMNQLMKNFNQLETYVDVQKLFAYVHQTLAAKQKQTDKSQLIWRSKKQIHLENEDILSSVREKLGPYNQKIFSRENQTLNELIKILQKQSKNSLHRTQNSSSSPPFNFCSIDKKQKEAGIKLTGQKQKWNFYEGNNYTCGQQIDKKNTQKPQITKLRFQKSLKKTQENVQLIHQVSTYLQIILEKHHRKKWGQKKKIVQNAHNLSSLPQQPQLSKKKSELRSLRTSTTHYDKNITFQSGLSSKKLSPQNSDLKQSQTKNYFFNRNSKSINRNISSNTSNTSLNLNPYKLIKKLSRSTAKKSVVNQVFTFRNRNIKQNLLKKISQFLDYVESEQKQFKKEKNCSINQLNYLQNKEKIAGYNNFIVDEQELKAVQNTVRMQK